jgi:hypothetical protein
MLQEIGQEQSRARPLNLKDFSNDTRPALSPARTTLLNILGIVGGNNVLASLGMVHHGLGVWEKPIEGPVEDTGSDK